MSKQLSKFEQNLERKRLKEEARDGFLPQSVKEIKDEDTLDGITRINNDQPEQIIDPDSDEEIDPDLPSTVANVETLKDESTLLNTELAKNELKIVPKGGSDRTKKDLNSNELVKKKGGHKEEVKEERKEEQQYAYRPKVHKRERIHDTHTSQAYMIENELISIVDEIVGDAWGGKYRFINEAIKLMIYQEFPEYADRIRVKE